MGIESSVDPSATGIVDLEQYSSAKKLVDRCYEFFAEIEDLTPGHELEARLNKDYGPGNEYYEDFCKYVKMGLDEGWLASIPIDGKRYRRGKIALPCAESRYISITAVYMESDETEQSSDYSGQYHAHPYGEINCVVVVDETAQLEGMQGWQGKGWTSPGPGTHHYPHVRGGGLVSLFFLPSGRISYKARPGMAQPISL